MTRRYISAAALDRFLVLVFGRYEHGHVAVLGLRHRRAAGRKRQGQGRQDHAQGVTRLAQKIQHICLLLLQ